ncbi:ras association domain-containing protein 4-like isoform X2 [Dysidea avara]
MPNCPKCGKPVYFAERKCSLGYDWHPNCLRCESCNKLLHPGKHSEHHGKPYCDIPCYQALFGPGGFGRGGVESYKYFDDNTLPPMDPQERAEQLARIKQYNLYKKGIEELSCTEINGRVSFEGILKIYWGLKKPITVLSERELMRRGSQRVESVMAAVEKVRAKMRRKKEEIAKQTIEEEKEKESSTEPEEMSMRKRTSTLPMNPRVLSPPDSMDFHEDESLLNGSANSAVEKRARNRQRSNSVGKRRSRVGSFRKYKENLENEPSSFTPPYGSATNLRVSNTSKMREVIKMLLIKFKVINDPGEFSLYVVQDTGVIQACKEEEHPLMTRLKLGPNEELAKIYIMEADSSVDVSAEAAEFIKFSFTELDLFLRKYSEEEEKAIAALRKKFDDLREPLVVQISEIRRQMLLSPHKETAV